MASVPEYDLPIDSEEIFSQMRKRDFFGFIGDENFLSSGDEAEDLRHHSVEFAERVKSSIQISRVKSSRELPFISIKVSAFEIMYRLL